MVRPIIVPQNDITNYYIPTNNYRIGRVEPPCGMENPKRVSFFFFHRNTFLYKQVTSVYLISAFQQPRVSVLDIIIRRYIYFGFMIIKLRGKLN